MTTIEEKLKATIRDVADFPKPGILFKDITPLLEDPALCNEIAECLIMPFRTEQVHAIVGVESRGFLFGMLMAQKLNIPFIPVRKAGKLPYKTISCSYDLEYGSATVEMHINSIKKDWKVIVHDDLLATGGTAAAAAELILMQDAQIAGFSFLVELAFLEGAQRLNHFQKNVHSLIRY
ncbi:MAG: adenine phosphoribosyltransferase [Bacteroidia bacterium]